MKYDITVPDAMFSTHMVLIMVMQHVDVQVAYRWHRAYGPLGMRSATTIFAGLTVLTAMKRRN